MINTVIYSKPHDSGNGGTYIVSSTNRTRVPNSIDNTDDTLRAEDININGTGEFICLNAQEGYISKLTGNVLDYELGTIKTLRSDQINSNRLVSDSADIKQALINQLASTNITTEYLTVTKQAHFFELIIDKIKSVGGQIILTPANCILDFVVPYDSNGNIVAEGSNTPVSFYRVYWRANDPVTGRSITNDWVVWDQALCQSFNNVSTGVNHNVANKYYWRLVTGVSSLPIWCDVSQKLIGNTEGTLSYDDRVDYGFYIFKRGSEYTTNINAELDINMTQTIIGTDNDITLKVEKTNSGGVQRGTPFRVYTGHKCSSVGLQVSVNNKRKLSEQLVSQGKTTEEAERISNNAKSSLYADKLLIMILKSTLGNTSENIAKDINVAVIFDDQSYMIFPSGTGHISTSPNVSSDIAIPLEFDISASDRPITDIIVYRNGHSEFVPCHWIDLSNEYIPKSNDYPTTAASNSGCDYMLSPQHGVPDGGDNLVQLGYRYDMAGDEVDENGHPTDTWSVKRASAIILAAYNSPDKEIEAPSYAQYQYIKDFNLSKYRGTYFAANGSEIAGDVTISETVYERLKNEIEDSMTDNVTYRLYAPHQTQMITSETGWIDNLQVMTIGVIRYTRDMDNAEDVITDDTLSDSTWGVYVGQIVPGSKRHRLFLAVYANTENTMDVSFQQRKHLIIPLCYDDEEHSRGRYPRYLNDPSHYITGCTSVNAIRVGETFNPAGSSGQLIYNFIKDFIKAQGSYFDPDNNGKITGLSIGLFRSNKDYSNEKWAWYKDYDDNVYNSLSEAEAAGHTWLNYKPTDDAYNANGINWNEAGPTAWGATRLDVANISFTNLVDIGFDISSSTSTIVIYWSGSPANLVDISSNSYKGSIPSGWSQAPSSYNPDLNEFIYMSSCTVTKDASNGTEVWTNWSVPIKMNMTSKLITLYICWDDENRTFPTKPTFANNAEWEEYIYEESVNPAGDRDEQPWYLWHKDPSWYPGRLVYSDGDVDDDYTSPLNDNPYHSQYKRYTIWMTQAYSYDDSQWSAFTDPIPISGKNGKGIEFRWLQVSSPSAMRERLPVSEHLSDWLVQPGGVDENAQYEYVTTRTSLVNNVDTGNVDVQNHQYGWTEWTYPTLWAKWGERGLDGTNLEYIYKLTESDQVRPSNPTPSDYGSDAYQHTEEYWTYLEDQGWTDEPQDVNSTYKVCWVCIRKKQDVTEYGNRYMKWGRFSDPSIWSRWSAKGADGASVLFLYKKSDRDIRPDSFVRNSQYYDPSIPDSNTMYWQGWARSMPMLTLEERSSGVAIWMTQAMVSSSEENGSIVYCWGEFTEPIIITGSDGKNGEDGILQEFIYCRVGDSQVSISYDSNNNISTISLSSSLNPNTINTSANGTSRTDEDFVPTGWTDNPSGISEDLPYEFVSQRQKKRTNGVMTWTEFSTPRIWSKWSSNGMDGDGIEYIFSNTSTTNPTPSNWQNTNSEYQRDGYVPSGWNDQMRGVSEQFNFEYVCMRKKTDNLWGRFSDPKVWAQWTERGMAGEGIKQFYMIVTIDFVSNNIHINYPSGTWIPTQGSRIDNVSSLRYAPSGWSETYPNLFSSSEKILNTESGRSYERIVMTQCLVKSNHNGTYLYYSFTQPMIISGSQGLPGKDGTEIEYLYARSKQLSYIPTFTNADIGSMQSEDWGVGRSTGLTAARGDTKWSDNPRGISEDYPVEWMCQRYYKKEKWGNFTTPVIWSRWGQNGLDGDGIEYVFLLSKTSTKPDLIDTAYTAGNKSWNNTMDDYLPKYTDSPYYSGEVRGNVKVWTDEPQDVNQTWKYQFVSIRKYEHGTGWGSFSTPALWSTFAVDGGGEFKLMPFKETAEVDAEGRIQLDFSYNVIRTFNENVQAMNSINYYSNNGECRTQYTIIGAVYSYDNTLLGIIPSTLWKSQLQSGTYNGPIIVSDWTYSNGMSLNWNNTAAQLFGDYWSLASSVNTISSLPHHVTFTLYRLVSPSDYSFASMKNTSTSINETGLEKVDQRVVQIIAKSSVIWKKTNDRIEQRITDKTTDIVNNGFRNTTYYNTLTNTAQQMQQVLGKISTLENANGTINNTITNINSHISTAEHDISELKQTEQYFNSLTGQLQTQIDSTNSLIRTAQTNISTLQQTTSNFNGELGQLSSQYVKINKRVETAESTISTLSSSYTNLSSSLTNTNERISTALSNISTLTTTINTINSTYVTKSVLKQTSDSLSSTITTIDNKFGSYATKSELTQTANSLSSTITNVDNKFGSYATKSQLTQTANSLTSTIDSKISGAKSEIKQTTDSISLQVQAAQNTANNAGETASNIGRNIQYGIQLNGSTGITLISDKVKFQSTAGDKLWLKGTDANGTTIFELGTKGKNGKRTQLLLRDTSLSTSSYGLFCVDLLQLVHNNQNIYLQFDSSLGPILRLVNGSYTAKFYVNSSGVYVQYQNQSAKKIS